MSTLFVSYRRSDSQGWAGRLGADLARAFGDVASFLDRESITPGDDFAKALDGAIGRAEAMLVLVGPRWLSASAEGPSRRLDDPADFVRREIAAGFARGLRMIPVLLGGAAMVKADQLPEPIAELASRQAFELSDTRWAYDCARLFEAIERNTSMRRRPKVDSKPGPAAIEVAEGLRLDGVTAGDVAGIKGEAPGSLPEPGGVIVAKGAWLRNSDVGDIVGIKRTTRAHERK